ncbi:hypothetical protein PHLGIDRAFT_30350 [Phlebiopsis gigantea 11061_1 CR5-6]|uniref:Tetrapyrrole biosynthesis uroporphyrinogen III synthase domain-containing protein n=1 Tax=Phlebiopsis gigantea (strain 11061_1 CR5-6) TaxID=745531 RepID=A0A0C3SA61_PHLG1|nr:hypothetical protein PHLGIDRAFT_30350 [Phlebiopsis gigantea 11061_1 CR5-6]
MSNVLLLRAPTTDGQDKYEVTFQAQGYKPICIPVLETVLVNVKDLQDLISQGSTITGLHGVIVTSARACEAWREAILSLEPKPSAGADWTSTPFYVVGEATATTLREIRGEVEGSVLAPKDIRGGAESGTSEKLAHFILRDLPASDKPRKLLYLIGDKNRDVLANILRDGGVELQAQQVYATQGSSSFPSDLRKAVESAPPESNCWWIVFFAPSAAEFVTPTLRKYFEVPDAHSTSYATKIAAIGPTTHDFLKDKLHIRVDVVAPKPSPDALVGVIHAFDQEAEHLVS